MAVERKDAIEEVRRALRKPAGSTSDAHADDASGALGEREKAEQPVEDAIQARIEATHAEDAE